MRLAYGVVSMACLLVIVTTTVPASAQPSDNTTLAEQLFNEGRELGKANKWAQACPKFEASLRYDPALGTRLNLATCYEKIGKLASAWGQYRDSADLAGKAGDKRRDFALKQAAALEPRLPKLTITAPANPPADLVVKRDGTALDAAILGSALYVDPGPHEIIATASGFETFKTTVTLAEAKAETVVIPELKPGVSTEPPKVPPQEGGGVVVEPRTTPNTPVDQPASPTRKYLGIGVAAGGAVILGIGFFMGTKASSTNDKAKDLCGSDLVCDNPEDFDRGKKLISDARSQATISTVGVVVGAAAIAGGVVIWLTAPKRRAVETARIVPVVTGSDVGVAVLGRF